MNENAPRLLIVDDIDHQRLLYQALSSRIGCDSVIVSSAEEALAAVAGDGTYPKLSFDLVILDWQLPKIDGITAMRQLRRLLPGTPMICITARAMPGDRESCLGSGMDDYLSKPFTVQQFTDLVHKWVKCAPLAD